MRSIVIASATMIIAACTTEPAPPQGQPPPSATNEPPSITEARALYPRAIDLHAKVIAKTCSPNPGVCHNSNNYPDLRTPAALLSAIEAPCNIEMPEPTQGWDACERRADWLIAGDYRTQIAWIERTAPGRWRLGLRSPPPVSAQRRPQIYSIDREAVFEPIEDWNASIDLAAGRSEAELVVAPEAAFVLELLDAAIGAAIGGDTNRNGVFGAEIEGERGAVIAPRDVRRSYLWGRITGAVPGTRMPLANAPLSNAAYAAIACWIEGLSADRTPSAADEIDYDRCDYAKSPEDPAVE